jgi:hypothetical protein
MNQEDDGPGWEMQEDNERRRWETDMQLIADFNRECLEFQRQWDERWERLRREQNEYFDREWKERMEQLRHREYVSLEAL